MEIKRKKTWGSHQDIFFRDMSRFDGEGNGVGFWIQTFLLKAKVFKSKLSCLTLFSIFLLLHIIVTHKNSLNQHISFSTQNIFFRLNFSWTSSKFNRAEKSFALETTRKKFFYFAAKMWYVFSGSCINKLFIRLPWRRKEVSVVKIKSRSWLRDQVFSFKAQLQI